MKKRTASQFTHGKSEIHERPALLEKIKLARTALGLRLRALRKVRGWNRERASEEIGIHPTTLAEIEAGSANPSLNILVSAAETFSVSLGELFENSET